MKAKKHAGHHKYGPLKFVTRGETGAYEKTCSVCGCVSREFESWSEVFRDGVRVSLSMRKVPLFSFPAHPAWRKERPPCTGASTKPNARDVAAKLAKSSRAKGQMR